MVPPVAQRVRGLGKGLSSSPQFVLAGRILLGADCQRVMTRLLAVKSDFEGYGKEYLRMR